MTDIAKRKSQHIELAAQAESQASNSPFENYRLPYVALPEIALSDVSTEVTLVGKTLAQPLIIASMTGGSEHGRAINTHLAMAAEKHRVALGVGSQRIALENSDAEDTFRLVRKHAPTTVIFANMGAVQLNYGRGVEDYQRVVDMIEADALYLHLNPLQEAIQPEGDTNFSGLLKKIAHLVAHVSVPVFVKEVGHGIDRASAERLIAVGVRGIDVAGVGGTSFAWIEAQRQKRAAYTEWFKECGVPTDVALQGVADLGSDSVHIVASGGVRTPIDALKARMLGARFYSAAQPFLAPALTSVEAVEEVITSWHQGLRIGLFAMGETQW